MDVELLKKVVLLASKWLGKPIERIISFDHDEEADVLAVRFKEGSMVDMEPLDEWGDVMAHVNEEGDIIGLTVMSASKHLAEVDVMPEMMRFRVKMLEASLEALRPEAFEELSSIARSALRCGLFSLWTHIYHALEHRNPVYLIGSVDWLRRALEEELGKEEAGKFIRSLLDEDIVPLAPRAGIPYRDLITAIIRFDLERHVSPETWAKSYGPDALNFWREASSRKHSPG